MHAPLNGVSTTPDINILAHSITPNLLIQAHMHIILQVPPLLYNDSIVDIQLNSSYYQIWLHCTVWLTFRQLLFFLLMFQ